MSKILSQERQQELLALGLLALALFLLLSFIPSSLLDLFGESRFPSGNVMGEVGGALHAVLFYYLGAGALLLPPLLALGGLRSGGWLSADWTARLSVLGMGLLLLLPMGVHVAVPDSAWRGAFGRWLATPVVAGLGRFGGSFLLIALLLLLVVGTLGWNPLRSIGWGLGRGAGLLKVVSQHLGPRARGWLENLADTWKSSREERKETMRSAAESDSFVFSDSAEDRVEIVEEEGPLAGQEKEVGPPLWTATAAADDVLPDPHPPGADGPHRLPSLEHLDVPDLSDRADMEKELDRLGDVLVEKLRTFNVQCSIGGRTTGPVVTQFEVVPAPGVKVNRIANLDADLALAMKAKSIRIVAPIPGKGAVGVEIPNPKAEMVFLREILEAPAFARSRAELPLALGRDLTGKPYVADLARMPHALIAGATGSGKSVCLNAFITSLVYRHTPETLRFLLIDPKMVELSAYVDLPHLRHPVVTDPRDAAGVLKWAVLEMERRYELLSVNGVRSLGELNAKIRQGETVRRVEADGPEGDPDRWLWTEGPIPYVVLVVDELADLMMTVQSEIEKPLTLLAQKARAIGIHLLVATQRPSVNVITGLIKANFPSRVAFRVAQKVDSRTILDQNGADALLGNGDMLFLPPGTSEPVRIQGAFISTKETERLIRWYRERTTVGADPASDRERWPAEEDILEVVRSMEAEAAMEEGGLDQDEERDEKFWDAAEVCIQQNQGARHCCNADSRSATAGRPVSWTSFTKRGSWGPPTVPGRGRSS